MAREHWNDVPGDIAGEDAEDLPGGFGTSNPDLNPEAMVDDLINNDVIGVTGTMFTMEDQYGGIVSGTGYADAQDDGSTVDPRDLLENEGEENPPIGGTPDESYTHMQKESMSVETEGPLGGDAGTPPRSHRGKAA